MVKLLGTFLICLSFAVGYVSCGGFLISCPEDNCLKKCLINAPPNSQVTFFTQYSPCSYGCIVNGVYTYHTEKNFSPCGTNKLCYQGQCLAVTNTTYCRRLYGYNYIGLEDPNNFCQYTCVPRDCSCGSYVESLPSNTICLVGWTNKLGICRDGVCIASNHGSYSANNEIVQNRAFFSPSNDKGVATPRGYVSMAQWIAENEGLIVFSQGQALGHQETVNTRSEATVSGGHQEGGYGSSSRQTQGYSRSQAQKEAAYGGSSRQTQGYSRSQAEKEAAYGGSSRQTQGYSRSQAQKEAAFGGSSRQTQGYSRSQAQQEEGYGSSSRQTQGYSRSQAQQAGGSGVSFSQAEKYSRSEAIRELGNSFGSSSFWTSQEADRGYAESHSGKSFLSKTLEGASNLEAFAGGAKRYVNDVMRVVKNTADEVANLDSSSVLSSITGTLDKSNDVGQLVQGISQGGTSAVAGGAVGNLESVLSGSKMSASNSAAKTSMSSSSSSSTSQSGSGSSSWATSGSGLSLEGVESGALNTVDSSLANAGSILSKSGSMSSSSSSSSSSESSEYSSSSSSSSSAGSSNIAVATSAVSGGGVGNILQSISL